MMLLSSTALAGGSAFFDQDAWTVDEKVTIELHYVVGPEGLATGDSLSILDPRMHGVRWSQWGIPVLDPSSCTPKTGDEDPSVGLVSVSTTGSGTLSLSRTVSDSGGSAKEDASTVVTVEAGSFAEGDEIVVTYGDTSQGADCGQELPERAFHEMAFEITEDIGGSSAKMASPPSFDIVAEDELAELFVEAPSRVITGEPFILRVVPMDRHGNEIAQWTGTVTLASEYGGASHSFTADDRGVAEFGLQIEDESKVHRIDVSTDDGDKGRSNPIQVAPSWDEFVYWGDIHVHHGHHYEEDGELIDENVHYARDVVGLDISAESMKADPVCLGSDELWEHLQEQCVSESVDGEYINLLAFEWMGNLLGSNNGHHNFYFDVCEYERPQHYDASGYPDGIDGFGSGRGPYEYADQALDDGARVVIIPHAPEYTGYNWGSDARNDDYRRSAEVYSEWGFNMEPETDDGSVLQGLYAGNHMGFIAASDNHVGWNGNPWSYKNELSGLAAFPAPALTREDVFDSLHARHTYATTGSRIILDVSIDDGATIPTGSRYIAADPVLHWSVSGTDQVAEVKVALMEVVSGASVADACVEEPGTLDASGSCALEWSGEAEAVVWVQITQEDGEQAWASPIWLEHDCEAAGVEDPADRCEGGETGDSGDTDDSGDSADTDDSRPDSATPDSGLEDTGLAGSRCSCASGAGGLSLLALAAPLWLRRRRG